jgi:hypothetical protein
MKNTTIINKINNKNTIQKEQKERKLGRVNQKWTNKIFKNTSKMNNRLK